MKRLKKAFTLAEAITVLVILGVVAAIVIPSTIHNYTEKSKVAKIKNAMETYSKIIESARAEHMMLSENNFYAWFKTNNCNNVYQYVKAINKNDCTFRTNDGLWWDVSNIQDPIIAFKRENLNSRVASDMSNYEAFYMSTLYDSSLVSFRVNDINWAQKQFKLQNYLRLQKLYRYANGETTSKNGVYYQDYEAGLQNLTLSPNETQTITLDGKTYQITNNSDSESTYTVTRYGDFTYIIGNSYGINDINSGSDNLFLYGNNITYNGKGDNRNIGFFGDDINMKVEVENVNIFTLDNCAQFNMCPQIGY